MNFSAGSIVLLSLLKIVQSSKEVAAEKLVRKKRWPEYTPYQTGLGVFDYFFACIFGFEFLLN